MSGFEFVKGLAAQLLAWWQQHPPSVACGDCNAAWGYISGRLTFQVGLCFHSFPRQPGPAGAALLHHARSRGP